MVVSLTRFLSVTAALLTGTAFLHAHAILLSATPAANSIAVGPQIAVSLKFNSRIDSRRSRLSVLLPDRTALNLTIQPQPSPDILTAAPTDLKSGDYRLRWQVLAADGHITRGEVPFHVQ
jgi:methionine-rich copper-binding protein CopC